VASASVHGGQRETKKTLASPVPAEIQSGQFSGSRFYPMKGCFMCFDKWNKTELIALLEMRGWQRFNRAERPKYRVFKQWINLDFPRRRFTLRQAAKVSRLAK
jgi:hypothetical protein